MILTFANLRVNTVSALENNIIADMESDVSAETSIIGDYAEIPPTQFGTIENGEIIWKESGSAGEAELMSTTSFICDTYSLLVSETASLLTDTIPSGTTVTWSSQNTDIATVSSSGVVTGVKAGTARINASVNDGTSTVVKQVSVYVIIENGVYYIKNNATSKYLHVNNSSIAENAGLVVSTKLTSDPARLAQLWRINYLGEGCYSIRPMHKLDMCLQRYGLGVAIGTRGTTENVSELSALAQWRISGVSSGYKLDSRSYTGNYLYVNGTAVSLGGTSNNVWSLEKLSSVPSGVLLYNTKNWIAPESTVTFVAAVYSGSTLNQGVTWTSSNTDVATVNSSGVITGVAAGTSVITVKSMYNTNWSCIFSIHVSAVPNGTYFIKNRETDRYLDIEGPSMAGNATIHQWDYYGHDSQKWIFELKDDGYYTIKSVYSGLYLSVKDDSAEQNAAVIQHSGGGGLGQRWKIKKISCGAYIISAKCGELTENCLAVGDYVININGIDIKHKTYANASNYQDEWYLAPSSVVLFGITSTHSSIKPTLENVKMDMENSGWNSVILRAGEFTADECLRDMKTPKIFVSSSHGNCIRFSDQGQVCTYIILDGNSTPKCLSSHSWNNMGSNFTAINDGDDFSNLDLAIFIACHSGDGGINSNNLPSRAVEQGAKTAIGFIGNLGVAGANEFIDDFFVYLNDGYTVMEALNSAESRFGPNGLSSVLCGDGSITIEP